MATKNITNIENIECLWGFSHSLGVFIVNRNDKTLYGLIDADGEIILEPQPKELLIRNEKQVLLHDFDIMLNVIPQSKEPIITDEKKVMQVGEKHRKDDKDIVLNLETGKTFFAKFSYPEKFNNAITWQEGKGYGAVDIDGNTIVPNKYLALQRIDNSLFAARDSTGKCGFIDNEGRETCEFVYDSIAGYSVLSSDMISVRQGTEWFVVDRSGRQLTRRRGCSSEDFWLMAVTPRGYAVFCEKRDKHTYYGLLDVAKDEIVIAAEYAKLYWLDRYPGGWTRLGAISDSVDSQSEERGVLTLSGESVLQKVEARHFYKGNYIVCRDRVDGVVNEAGQTIIPFDFRCINRKGEVYAVSRYDTKLFGVYSLTGEVLLPCEYDDIDFGDTLDYIAVCKNGEWYYVNIRGERVLL